MPRPDLTAAAFATLRHALRAVGIVGEDARLVLSLVRRLVTANADRTAARAARKA